MGKNSESQVSSSFAKSTIVDRASIRPTRRTSVISVDYFRGTTDGGRFFKEEWLLCELFTFSSNMQHLSKRVRSGRSLRSSRMSASSHSSPIFASGQNFSKAVDFDASLAARH